MVMNDNPAPLRPAARGTAREPSSLIAISRQIPQFRSRICLETPIFIGAIGTRAPATSPSPPSGPSVLNGQLSGAARLGCPVQEVVERREGLFVSPARPQLVGCLPDRPLEDGPPVNEAFLSLVPASIITLACRA